MKKTKIFKVGCFMMLAVMIFACRNILVADGVDLVVPKRDISGVVDDPPAPAVGEYTESGTFTNGKGTFQIQTYRSTDGSVEEIQFYFETVDGSSDDGDKIQIYFDMEHDHSASADYDRGILIKRQGPGIVRKTQVNLFGQPTELADLPAGQWKIDPDTGAGWTVEVKINAGDLDLNFIPSLLGMHITVDDVTVDSGTITGTYPDQNVFNINAWANLKTRNNLEYVLLLDQSGSMEENFDGLYDSPPEYWKWTAAKKASDIFAHIYHAFRPTEDVSSNPYFDDKIGMATYVWDYETDVDASTEVKSLNLLKNITVDGYTDSPPAPAGPSDRTPIKRGLNTAFSMFSPAGSNVERVVLLLSDGLHNEPSYDYYDEDYVFLSDTAETDYQVNAVALGLDEAVDTGLLNDIRLYFLGFGGSYTNPIEENALVDSFSENLFSHLYLNRVDVDETTGEFMVNANEPRLLVMLIWNTAVEADPERGFRLKKPDGGIIETDDPDVTYHHFKNAALNYEISYYLLDFPESDDTLPWQTIALSSSAAEVADNRYALFDPTIYAFFTVVQEGEDFILKAVLKERGVPITEPGATVTFNVSKPDEGLGTYASTAQPDCTFAPPKPPKEYDPRFAAHNLADLKKRVTLRRPEPLPAYLLWVYYLFDKCGKTGLARSDGELKLYDDGTHGDRTAGDGIFTLRYTDTRYEGSYTFHFAASGTAPSGSAFSRIKTLSIHKSIDVDPESSETGVVDRGVFEEYYRRKEIFVIPRDFNGEYLGPAHHNRVKFETNIKGGFRKNNPVINYNNGMYSRLLEYDEREDMPEVYISVQGKQFKPIRVYKAFELTLPFAGTTRFDSILGLKNGPVVGAKLGFRVRRELTLELEAGLGFTEEITTGDKGNWLQLMANFRSDFDMPGGMRWKPFLTAGAGVVLFRGLTVNHEAFAFQGGGGFTYRFSRSLGLRFDARWFWLQPVFGASVTTNFQAAGGLVFWF